MVETTQTTEPKIRLNMKQSAKGELYGECTVRAETMEEAKTLLLEGIEIVKANSTVGVK